MKTIVSQASRESTNDIALHSGLLNGISSLDDTEIKFVGPTINVLRELEMGNASYGSFAVCDTKNEGIVDQTRDAFAIYGIEIQRIGSQTELNYSLSENGFFKIVKEFPWQVDHAIYGIKNLPPKEVKYIHSHPQALKAHEDFLRSFFPNARLIEEPEGTSASLDKLLKGEYEDSEHSLAITTDFWDKYRGGPKEGSVVVLTPQELKSNEGYQVKIVLASKV